MNRATFQLARNAILVAIALGNSARADGFDPIGARALFRDLGVSLGPGYHHAPCLPHLRQHYQMAVTGHPLPASKVTPLHLFNGYCMQASRYVPLEERSTILVRPAFQGGIRPQAVQYQDLSQAAAGLVPMPADPDGPATWAPANSEQLQRTDDEPRSTIGRDSQNADDRDDQQEDQQRAFRGGRATRRPSSFDSPFEPYSPNAPDDDETFMPRNTDLPQPRPESLPDAPNTEENSAAAKPSPMPVPAPAATYNDGSQGFEDVEIEDDLTPADT